VKLLAGNAHPTLAEGLARELDVPLVTAAVGGGVVSRGRRPDLAKDHLTSVQAPTLLIVGGNGDRAIELNEQALLMLRCPKELVVIPGATHLFEEPGTLEEVSRLAKE
jgi:predicted alpha/beta-hydrolase family hydrolase